MIIYNKRKPIDCIDGDCVGVTGDNLAHTQEFYIGGISDNSISYTLHLRFADNSVNSVTPSYVSTDGEGTLIRWVVTKNDIFTHGSFEVQIEGTNSLGLVFQTEIVRLYADESIPIEDKTYENPNSETLKLREQAQKALEDLKAQQQALEQNIEKINTVTLDKKADKSDVYTKAEIQEYLAENYYSAEASDANFEQKFDDDEHNGIVVVRPIDAKPYVQLTPTMLSTINGKYDSSNIENGSGTFIFNASLISSASFNYQRIDTFCMLTIDATFAGDISGGSLISLSGLPFKCRSQVRIPVITNDDVTITLTTRNNATRITIETSDTILKSGTSLKAMVIYKI